MRHEGRCPSMSGVSPWNDGLIKECRGEACPCKEGRPVHPPILFAFHPELGGYIQAEARCTARHAGYGPGFLKGQICGERATHQFGDIWVCEPHWKRARKWALEELGKQVAIDEMMHMADVYDERRRLEGEVHKERLRQRREEAALERELARERILAEDAARAESSLVYYVQREPDDLIKIGTSRTIAARLATLARTHGALHLMATHGGGHKEEHEVHVKFKELRVEGEWFRPELPLIQHIAEIRKSGDPTRAPGLPECIDARKINGMLTRLRYVARNAAEVAA